MEEKKSRIIIRDLPEDEKIGQEQMRKILGGALIKGFKQPQPGEPMPWPYPKFPGTVYW